MDFATQILLVTLRSVVERMSSLQSQVSPENFWRDGEKPRTEANQRALANLQGQLTKKENEARHLLAQLEPEEHQAFLQTLPAHLLLTVESMPPAMPKRQHARRKANARAR